MTLIELAIYSAFEKWLKENPQGGRFEYHGFVLIVTKKQ